MIAIDANVLVRLLTGDDPAQAERAADLFSRERIHIPKSVLLETEWVLRYSYALSLVVILSSMRKVLGLPQVSVEDELSIVEALAAYAQGMDFADALHLASSARHAEEFATFDVRLKKRSASPKVRQL